MRKIQPYFNDSPNELWVETSKKRSKTKSNPLGDSKIESAIKQKSAHKFDRTVYGSKIVKNKLKVIFKGKCAFCETNTHVGAHKDVEHYRIKQHYYWLAYEWTNFLQACQICNRDFKGSQFPLENETNRIIQPPLSINGTFDPPSCHIESMNLIEKPLLLHPAIDNPREHLRFFPNGEVEGITNKGKISIQVYGLNRENLKDARKSIVYQLRKDIWEEYIHTTPDAERVRIEVTKVISKLISWIKNEQFEYIGFATTILENFETFIIDNQDQGIDMPDKNIMRQTARTILR